MNDTAKVFTLSFEEEFAIITIDIPGESQNTLKSAFGSEIESVFDTIKAKGGIKAIIVQSGKDDSFIAGADISMLKAAETKEEVEAISKVAHDAFERIEQSTIPVVAAINGACLGGGYEFAMACHARIATDESVTVFGLPEVQLGVLPAGGGTQRLPRLVGIANALDLMLSGRRLNAKRAKKMGLVDEVVPKAILMQAAKKWASTLASSGDFRNKNRQESNWWDSVTSISGIQKLALEENSFGRNILFDQARKKTMSKTLGNYPAPERIIDCVEIGMEHGLKRGYEAERQAFGELVTSPEAAQLMNIFFASTDLKKETGVDAEVEVKPIKHLGVLGGGLMGAGIALVSVDKAGVATRVKDRDDKGVANAMKYAWRYFDKRRKRRSITEAEMAQKMAMLTSTTTYDGMKHSDLYIEAVFEDLDLKHQIIKDIQEQGNADAIIASNTSSIPITEIAKASSKPEQVIGLHYFSPVEKMPLLEIVITEQTADWVIASCVAFGKKQGKTVIVVNDGPGFYTSRILAPYMNEAGYLIEEGVAIDWLDEALREFGFPVGPITLVDEVGIDVGAKIAPILSDALGDRMRPPESFNKVLADGRLGRKNSKGFYRYEGQGSGKKEVDDSIYSLLNLRPERRMAKAEISERCSLQMLNEAVYCLQENIVRSPRDGDIGAIFGLGFPPFLGGPFRYADSLGAAQVVEKMMRYRDKHGARFEPCDLLKEMAKANKSFYD